MTDQGFIEQVVAEVLRRLEPDSTTGPEPVENLARSLAEDGALPDLTAPEEKAVALIDHPLDPDEIDRLRTATPARIGIGRAGPRMKTKTLLTLRADHAAARDAVMSDVDPALIERLGLLHVKTLCESRDEHLTRPDLGRQFAPETLAQLKQHCKPGPRVQVYASDGLSSKAIEAGLEDFLPALTHGLSRRGIEMGTPFFVQYGRVPAMDAVSELLGAEVTCVMIGERPGLATADSMSAYIAYNASVGMPESRRTVVSNIHKGGLYAVEAGAYVADVIAAMLEKKQSGVDLKL